MELVHRPCQVALIQVLVVALTWGHSAQTTGALNTSALPCNKVYDFTIGFSSEFYGTSVALAGVIMADMEFRKWIEPSLQSRFGPIYFPIPDRNPCFTIRPITLDYGSDAGKMDELSMWNVLALADGTHGYPKADAIVTYSNFNSELKIATVLAVKMIPHLTVATLPELSDKTRYPFTFRSTSPDAIMSDIAMWYILHFKFRTATVIYGAHALGQSLFTGFMQRAVAAQYSDRIFAFALPSTLNHADLMTVAADVALRAKKMPTRLLVVFASGEKEEQNLLYAALKAEGLWMPKYQIFASISHMTSAIQTTPDGIKEMVETPIHYTSMVQDVSPNLDAHGFYSMLSSIAMDIVLQGLPRYMLNSWNLAIPAWNSAALDPGFFTRPLSGNDARTVAAITNQFMTVAHAINKLMNTIDPETIDGTKILENMKHVQMPALETKLLRYDINQDVIEQWGVYYTCSHCNGVSSGVLNVSTLPFCAGASGSFVPVLPARWANGETSLSAPDELTQCQPGQSITSSGSCQTCKSGWITADINQSACIACEPGKFAEADATMCTSCPPGRGAVESGSTACLACPKGFAGIGGGRCEACQEGRYADEAAMSMCKSCEVVLMGSSSLRAAASSAECVCLENSFQEIANASCRPCPAKMVCRMGSSMANYFSMKAMGFPDNDKQLYPILEKHYWSSVDKPLSVFLCSSDVSCPGGPPGTCGANTRGQSCGKCEEDHYLTIDGQCERCASKVVSLILFPLIPIVLAPIIIGGSYYVFRDLPKNWESWQNLLASLLLLLLSHYQTLGIISHANVDLPSSPGGVLASFTWTNDPLSIFRVGCAGISGFTWIYLLKVLLPVFVLLLVICTYLCSWALSNACMRGIGMEMDRTINVYMSLIYTFFAAIASTSMLLFKFLKSPNEELSLAADASVLQSSLDWKSAFALAVCSLLFECIGVVTLLLYVIQVAPTRFHRVYFQKRWKFLFIKYRPDVFWWGVPYMMRGLMVNLSLVVVVHGCRQLYTIYFSMLAYTSLVIMYRPWRNGPTNGLDILGCLVVSTVAVISTWFGKDYDLSSDVEDLIVVLSFGAALTFVVAVGILVLPRFLRERLPQMQNRHRMLLVGQKNNFRQACKLIASLRDEEVDEFFMEYLQDHDRVVFSQVAQCIMLEFYLFYSGSRLCRNDFKEIGRSSSKELKEVVGRTDSNGSKQRDAGTVEVFCDKPREDIVKLAYIEEIKEPKLIMEVVPLEGIDWPYEITPRSAGWKCSHPLAHIPIQASLSPRLSGKPSVVNTPRSNTPRISPRLVITPRSHRDSTPRDFTPGGADTPIALTPHGF